jgi:hypothetical protein
MYLVCALSPVTAVWLPLGIFSYLRYVFVVCVIYVFRLKSICVICAYIYIYIYIYI